MGPFGILVVRFAILSAAILLNLSNASARTSDGEWVGEWITSKGAIRLTHSDDTVNGEFTGGGKFRGTLSAGKLTANCTKGNESWTAEIELDDKGRAFKGELRSAAGAESWRGWKRDPNAGSDKMADFSGTWLCNWGTMQLVQDGDRVTGFYTSARWGSLEGTVSGRKLKFKWKRLNSQGEAEIEMSIDRSRFYGMSLRDEATVCFGIKPAKFRQHAEPIAGAIVQGIADNGMLYYLRMPEGWTAGREVDVVVLLHGSNWTTAGMVYITNENWPSIGKRFAILGIQGESWATWSDADDLRFNYTYVNWVGRSTYRGYPGTDRESPYLVAEVIDELDKLYSFGRIFVGGHSQGGFLAYVMHMNFAEKLAGTFPIAGGVIFQAEPDAFDNKNLMKAQRAIPMAIVHGKKDGVIDFSMSEYAYEIFLAGGFTQVRLIDPDLDHPYDFLPIDEAINYLDTLTTANEEQLAAFAQAEVEKKNWRDVGNAITRAKAIDAGKAFSPIWRQYEDAAKKDSARVLSAIQANKNGKWIDDFLEYQQQFSQAGAAKSVLEAFHKLRDQHQPPAEKLYSEANQAFQNGNRAKGFELYKKVVEKYYASPRYRAVRRSLDKSNQ
jgi:predicted esterase